MSLDLPTTINDADFSQFRQLIYKIAGINMADSKKTLMVGRLNRRLRHHQIASFDAYYRMVTHPAQQAELQIMVDMLTTNETYFFREQAHFDFMVSSILPQHPAGKSFDVWSAASSTGEEIYTISFVLADKLGINAPWTVTGSDISTAVLATAQKGTYWLDRVRGLPPECLRKYCVKGTGDEAGSVTISPDIKRHTKFMQANLNRTLPAGLQKYHLIFLRNVMIYFDNDTKRQVVARLIERLQPRGYLIVGHSETLNGLTDRVKAVKPTIYQLPA